MWEWVKKSTIPIKRMSIIINEEDNNHSLKRFSIVYDEEEVGMINFRTRRNEVVLSFKITNEYFKSEIGSLVENFNNFLIDYGEIQSLTFVLKKEYVDLYRELLTGEYNGYYGEIQWLKRRVLS